MVLSFFQHADFVGERGSPAGRPPPSSRTHLHIPEGPQRQRFMAQFNEVGFDRHGVMQGEYILLDNGLALISRGGEIIRINSYADDAGAPMINAFFASPGLRSQLDAWLLHWDTLPLVQGLPCVMEPFCGNYFHFTCELIPRLRFLQRAECDMIGIPWVCLNKTFQRSLLARTTGSKVVLPLTAPIRVRDPRLALSSISPEAIGWLRRAMAADSRPGSRRIYIRRGGSITRTPPGGGISEDAAFMALLDRFGFETIAFGGGDYGVPEQIGMLDGAAIILAAHGASLTNIAYLNPPLTLIEIFGERTISGIPFMLIADSLGIPYHGLMFPDVDEHNDIIVDCDVLSELLRNI